MHFHVRGSDGKHTLDHAVYAPVLKELEAAVGGNLLLQVSSEAVGIYGAEEQIEQMRRLAPHCLSFGLQEIFPPGRDCSCGNVFLSTLRSEGVLVQIILYSPEQVRRYEQLCAQGIIPGEDHFLLFVLGRHGKYEPADLRAYLSALRGGSPWMVCGFGNREHELMELAVQLGGHCRVGFENNHLLADNTPAPDNAALVRRTAAMIRAAGRFPAGRSYAASLHGW